MSQIESPPSARRLALAGAGDGEHVDAGIGPAVSPRRKVIGFAPREAGEHRVSAASTDEDRCQTPLRGV